MGSRLHEEGSNSGESSGRRSGRKGSKRTTAGVDSEICEHVVAQQQTVVLGGFAVADVALRRFLSAQTFRGTRPLTRAAVCLRRK